MKRLLRESRFMKFFFTAVTILAILVSCKKEVTELPPATQTGANTFGAKVNGSFWVPQGFGSIPAGNILTVVQSGTDIIINAQNFSSSPNEKEFLIRLKDVTAPGTYLLNSNVVHPSATASYAYYVKRYFTPQDEWITSATHTGSVTISKIDTAAHIVSGTFQFSMQNIYNEPEPLSVTEGRFDLLMQ